MGSMVARFQVSTGGDRNQERDLVERERDLVEGEREREIGRWGRKLS